MYKKWDNSHDPKDRSHEVSFFVCTAQRMKLGRTCETCSQQIKQTGASFNGSCHLLLSRHVSFGDIPGCSCLDIPLTTSSTAGDVISAARRRLPDLPWHGNQMLSCGARQLQHDDKVDADDGVLLLANFAEISNQETMICAKWSCRNFRDQDSHSKTLAFFHLDLVRDQRRLHT